MVNTGSSFPSVLCHLFHCEHFRIIRVRQCPLQGFDLAPLSFLYGLCNTHLQFLHALFCIGKVNVLPVLTDARSRTQFPVHLLYPFQIFLKFSCKERPDGSLHPFGQGNVATSIPAVTARHSLFPSSCTRTFISVPRGKPSIQLWEGTGLPRST